MLNEEPLPKPPAWWKYVTDYYRGVSLPRPDWATWRHAMIRLGSQNGFSFVRSVRNSIDGQMYTFVWDGEKWRRLTPNDVPNIPALNNDIQHLQRVFPNFRQFYRRSDGHLIVIGEDGQMYWYRPSRPEGERIVPIKPGQGFDPESSPLENPENSDDIPFDNDGFIPEPRPYVPRQPGQPPSVTLPEPGQPPVVLPGNFPNIPPHGQCPGPFCPGWGSPGPRWTSPINPTLPGGGGGGSGGPTVTT